MHPPSLPLHIWWSAAVAVTIFFLLFFVPLMPNRRYKIQISLAPAAAAAFAALSALAKNVGPEVLLPLYSFGIFAFPIAFLGHRKELREKTLNMAQHGESRDNALSVGLQLQLVFVCAVVGSLGAWFSMAA